MECGFLLRLLVQHLFPDMTKARFIEELVALGYKPTEKTIADRTFLVLPYSVATGKFVGQDLQLALEVPPGFPSIPPGGPHISPELLPLTSGGVHPSGGIHGSPLGNGWQYWSRPFQGWNEGDRTAKRYMSHINTLFHTQ